MHTCPAQALVYALRRRPSAGFSLACAPHPVCHFGIWHACVRGRCALAHACSVLYAHVTSVGTLLWYARYTGQGRRSCARRAEHVGPSVVAWCSTLDRTGNTTQEYTKAGYFAHHRAYTSQLSNLAVIPSSPLPPTPHHSRSRFQVDDKRRIFPFHFLLGVHSRVVPLPIGPMMAIVSSTASPRGHMRRSDCLSPVLTDTEKYFLTFAFLEHSS